MPISPIRLHGGPSATVDRPATLLGQDTDRVLSELLGLTPDELAALHAAGVIEPVKSERTHRRILRTSSPHLWSTIADAIPALDSDHRPV